MTKLNLQTVKADIDELLDGFFKQQIADSQLLDAQYQALWLAMESQVQAGGKRLRPYCLLLAYQAYGGRQYQRVLPVAAAHELLHTSLLMHDDIIDRDYTRHGQLNVAGQMQQHYRRVQPSVQVEHYANGAALLAGDLLIAGAYQIITNCRLSSRLKLIASASLSSSLFYVCGGELLDMESALRPINQAQALKVADLKTARYSCVEPLLTGARLANASELELAKLRTLGVAFGVAYQLTDDLLGIFGDPKITGKSVLSDIREGKQTYLMLEALQRATAADKLVLTKQLGNQQLDDNDAALVRTIVERSGARTTCQQKIASYLAQAQTALNQLAIGSSDKQPFDDLITSIAQRIH